MHKTNKKLIKVLLFYLLGCRHGYYKIPPKRKNLKKNSSIYSICWKVGFKSGHYHELASKISGFDLCRWVSGNLYTVGI